MQNVFLTYLRTSAYTLIKLTLCETVLYKAQTLSLVALFIYKSLPKVNSWLGLFLLIWGA